MCIDDLIYTIAVEGLKQIPNISKPDVPRRLAFSNFEHNYLVSLSSEHRNTQTDRQLKTLSGSLSKL